MRILKTAICLVSISLLLASCQADFLDVKRDKRQVIPTSLKDYQSIIDNELLNIRTAFTVGDLGADDFFVSDEHFDLTPIAWERNAYTWQKDIFEGAQALVWDQNYEKILYSNLVLDGLSKIEPSGDELIQWNNIRGSALFFRAYTYFQLSQIFCNNYDGSKSATDLGLPIKLTPDLNEKVKRSTVQETYDFIVNDLLEALTLLTPLKEIYKNRPTANSTLALLARIFLQMDDYQNALYYADEFLSVQHELLNYNNVSSTNYYPFSVYGEGNPEHILIDRAFSCALLTNPRLQISTELLDLYGENDLRKVLYFIETNSGIGYRGSYNGTALLSGSPTVSEVLLIRAECNLRLNRVNASLDDLNWLLKNRYVTNEFEDIKEEDEEKLLDIILEERRKELVFRGLRWSDLRRINKDPKRKKTLFRTVNGEEFSIQPEDKRYTWPIPDIEVKINNMIQNER